MSEHDRYLGCVEVRVSSRSARLTVELGAVHVRAGWNTDGRWSRPRACGSRSQYLMTGVVDAGRAWVAADVYPTRWPWRCGRGEV